MKVKYNTETGEILGYAILGDLLVETGEATLQTSATPPEPLTEYQVIDGAVVKKADTQIRSINDELKWNGIRFERDKLLQEADGQSFVSISAIIKGEEKPSNAIAWETYKQSLRDITDQEDPNNITWPTKPE